MKLIFLHGLTGSHYNFDDMKNEFADTFDTISFDIIGFASAEKPKTTYNKQLYMNFLETKIKDKCIIVGHSMGAILAKDFAIKYPELVQRIYLISYPLQRNQDGIRDILNKDILIKFYMSNSLISRFFCNSKIVWKYFYLWIIFIFKNKYYLSAQDYFKHTYNSVYSSIVDYIEKDDWKTINKVKEKAVFISGEKDFYVDKTLLKNFKHYTIPNMGHLFASYQVEIIKIIKDDIKSNLSKKTAI